MSTQIEEILVQDVMMNCDSFPVVSDKELLRETIIEMCNFGLGIACIVNTNNQLKGVFTDGDIRRLILKLQKPIAALFVDDVKDYCTKIYASIKPDTSLKRAILLMEELNIWDLPVVDNENNLKGLLHLHPALKKLLGI
ncbi:MAG: CBS domain-containing protein [Flavobacteriaceae bacterium]|nr:CBS domain-containing protein [Flavobacteriaceae bacterium]